MYDISFLAGAKFLCTSTNMTVIFSTDEPYPVEVKPPLPSDVLVDNARVNTTNTDSSNDNHKQLSESISQHREGPELNSVTNTDFNVSPKTGVSKQINHHMLPRRFRHVFQDMCDSKWILILI